MYIHTYYIHTYTLKTRSKPTLCGEGAMALGNCLNAVSLAMHETTQDLHIAHSPCFCLYSYCMISSTGLLLMYTKEYSKALEVFRGLQKQYPGNASYAKQVQILEEGLAKTRTPGQTQLQENT